MITAGPPIKKSEEVFNGEIAISKEYLLRGHKPRFEFADGLIAEVIFYKQNYIFWDVTLRDVTFKKVLVMVW